MTVLLRPVIDSDIPIFFAQQNDPIANELAAFPARDQEAFFAHWDRIRAIDNVIIRTVLYGDEVAGNIESFEMEGKREVGYWLGRDFWGKGIASQALADFIQIEPARPLYGYAARHNLGSQRVLEKCGFEPFGEDGIYRIFVLK